MAAAQPQTTPRREAPQAPQRTAPELCIFSKHLAKLHYSELGPVIKSMGFEGCDLTVRPGGHVLPERAPADLFRAIEGLRDEGVSVPMITTGFTTLNDPWARNVLAIAGSMGVPYFKPGYWQWNGAADIDTRLAEVKRDLAGLTLFGRQYRIAMGVHNHSGDYVGQAVWDTRSLIADLDPRWVGYYFDPSHATVEGGRGGWNIAMRLALPRLKMVAIKDFYWAKEGGKWLPKSCPLGEGMVDWPAVFAALAKARFTGPISLHVEYQPKDEVAAMARDLEFTRKLVGAAYVNVS
jgi:L-ribulose-5-phosphate 3-epimerase